MASRRHRLAERRKAVGYTQEQLAEQLGVERTTVARWEAGGTQPQPWQRPNLATALGLSADELQKLLTAPVPAGEAPARSTDAALVEPPSTILDRIRQHSASHLTDTLL